MQPSDACVVQGETYTCTATSGHPGSPSYAMHYWTDGTNALVSQGQSYQVNAVGNFSLACVATYSHQHCQQHTASCYANYTGTAIYRESTTTFDAETVSVLLKL